VPDPLLIFKASTAAATVAVLVLLVFGWPWKAPRQALVAAGGALAVGGGFLAGGWLLGGHWHLPPQDDQDRLFLWLLPAVVVAEVLAAAVGRLVWLSWMLRLPVAAGAVPILLHGSIYLTDLSGPGTREWSAEQTWLILSALAATLVCGWALLDQLAGRTGGRAVLVTLALACLGAGLTIMLSGYASGGQLGIPLAAGVGGAAILSFLLKGTPDWRGSIGVGIVVLFGLLVSGRFFGSLTTTNAALLFAAPLVAWLPELPLVRRVGPRLRGFARVALSAVPVAIVVLLAVQKFNAASKPPSATTNSPEPSLRDYLDYGK
jgi:hypothetical protein